VVYALALIAILLVGCGYLLGARRGRRGEQALRAELDTRNEKLTIAEHELLRQSQVDATTGLHTQQYFQEFLEREWRRASRERQFVSVIMIEIDYFRALNERHGTADADGCLRAVANTLKPLIHRPSDVVARYGGAGKFGAVLGATDSKGALAVAERLRHAVEGLRKANPASATSQFVTATLGVASAMPDREGTWQDIELIAAAERALTQAHEAGRNVVVLDVQQPIRSR
jgi:diguanylate cyclase (GGDEF)-like protein